MDVILVHGYNVTSTKTYGVLPQRLKSLGYNVKDVYISKYITLDNELNVSDLVRAFHAALLDVYGSKLEDKTFACITHSTGGLVVRAWIETYYSDRMKALPISHLIMLAPPTNGSRLAGVGKSRLSRLRSLWGVDPGLKILDALDLGSEVQWDLNSIWMRKKLHAAPAFYPVVITGQWIDKKLWDVIVPATYERGSDGVIRAASANLNMQKYTLSANGKVLHEVMGAIPFLVTPKTSHSDEAYGIMSSIPSKGDHPVLNAITSVLQVKDKRAYQALEADFAMKTTLLQRNDTYHDGSPLDRYSQLVVRVTDNAGNKVHDYAVELLDAEGRGDRFPSGFLPHSAQNPTNPEFFVYYLNYTQISKVIGKQVGVRVQSVPQSPMVRYADGRLAGPATEVGLFMKPNETTFLEIQMDRQLNKEVFRLSKNFSYQKIKRIPGPDWIE